MYRNKLILISISLGLIFSMLSCMTPIAPKGWLPTAKESTNDAFGAWIVVKNKHKDGTTMNAGEFIAYHEEKLYVLTRGGPAVIPVADVITATVAVHSNQQDKVFIWTIGGTLSTLSHGFYLIFSAPVWLLSGILAGVQESKGGMIIIEEKTFAWDTIKKYARFPQGLPDNIDISELLPKPVL